MDKLYENYEIKLKQIYRTLFFMYGINITRVSKYKSYIDWGQVAELLTSLIEIVEMAQKEKVDLGLIPIYHCTIDAINYYNFGKQNCFSYKKKKLLFAFNHLNDLCMTFTPKIEKDVSPSNIDELIKSAGIFKLSAIVGMNYYGAYQGIYAFDKYSTADELMFDLKAASKTQLIKVGECIKYLMNKIWNIPNIRHIKGGKKLADSLLVLYEEMIWQKGSHYTDYISIKYKLLEMAENLAGEIDEPKQQSPIDEVIKSMHMFSFKSFELFFRTRQLAKEYYTSEKEVSRACFSAGNSPVLKAFNHLLYIRLSEQPELKDTAILRDLKYYCDTHEITAVQLKKAKTVITALEVSDDLRLLATESRDLPKRKDLETLLKFQDILNRLMVIIGRFDYHDKVLFDIGDFNLIVFYIEEYLNYLDSRNKKSIAKDPQDFENMQIPSLEQILMFFEGNLPGDSIGSYETSGQLIYDIYRLSKKSDWERRDYIAKVCQQILNLTSGDGLAEEDLPASTLRMVAAANSFTENNMSSALRLLLARRKIDNHLKK